MTREIKVVAGIVMFIGITYGFLACYALNVNPLHVDLFRWVPDKARVVVPE